MRAFLAIHLAFGLVTGAIAEVPDVNTFRPVPTFPDPAAGASLTLGTTDSGNGRLVLWNGDAVFYQDAPNNVLGPLIPQVAMGYLGDPSFVSLHSNNLGVYLGSGSDALVYEIPNIQSPADFAPGAEFDVVTFFSGTLLNDAVLVLDRMRDDMTGAELVVVDIALAKAADPNAIRAVLQKPAGSLPAAVFVDRGTGVAFIMNRATRELRSFSTTALADAYANSVPLDWAADGTLIGTAAQFLNGGVYGVNPDNELLIGGDTGAAGTGGIQYVSQTPPATIVDTLDPAGTGPAYVLIYSRVVDEVLAIDPSVSPPVAYASTDFVPAIPPDSPCMDFDAIEQEYAAFLAAYAPGMTDLDGDSIRDSAMLQLVRIFSCRANATSALAFSTNTAYDDNREVFAAEANAAVLQPYERILPILLFMNQAMRAAVLDVLSTGGTPLAGAYVTVSCMDLENCEPEFVEDPFTARNVPRGVTEPYSATGDPDGDGLTNLEEYNNSQGIGGNDLDFAVAAASDQLDGTGGLLDVSGGCFIATAAYGSPLSAELDSLRAVRDGALLRSPLGGAVVDLYYRVSPAIAARIANRPAARAAVRATLLPFVSGRQEAWGIGLLAVAFVTAAIARSLRKPAAVPRK